MLAINTVRNRYQSERYEPRPNTRDDCLYITRFKSSAPAFSKFHPNHSCNLSSKARFRRIYHYRASLCRKRPRSGHLSAPPYFKSSHEDISHRNNKTLAASAARKTTRLDHRSFFNMFLVSSQTDVARRDLSCRLSSSYSSSSFIIHQ